MPWYQEQISNCTYRQFTTGFFYGKPDSNTQIYTDNTYEKNFTYLGFAEDVYKRQGVKIEAVYFHAPPYTSERAKQKVVDLAKLVAKYSGPIRLHVVNFTDIQLYIYDQCPHDELTIIMRRYMMRIAEHFAKKDNCRGLITGESIGQVASQTLQSLAATNEVCTPVSYTHLDVYKRQMQH